MLLPNLGNPKDHKVTEALEEAYTSLYGNERIGAEDTVEMRKARPLTDKWTFSTMVFPSWAVMVSLASASVLAQKHKHMLLTKLHGNKTL